MDPEALMQYCLMAPDELEMIFLRQTYGVPHQHGGMLPSELLVFGSLCWIQEVDVIYESGRRFGYSTEVLSRFSVTKDIYSWDLTEQPRDKWLEKNCPNVILGIGDSTKYVGQDMVSISGRVALLIDGPKGPPAFEMFDKCKDEVVVCAIHDLSRRSEKKGVSGGQENMSRTTAEKRFNGCYLEGEDFVARYGYLDESAWRRDYNSREDMTRYGFSLGIFPGGKWRGA